MDISSLNIPETATVHLEFPGIGKLYADDKKKQPTIIEMYGPASDQAVAYRRKLTRKMQGEMAKRGMKAMSSGDPEEQEVDRLTALTASVSGLVYEGQEITKDTIRKVYEDQRMGWIRDQVREKVGSWDDFLL